MQGDGLPTPTDTCYFDAFQVVVDQLAKQHLPHEWTNMTVVPDPPDNCSVFDELSLCNTLVVSLVNFLSVDNTGGFRLLQYLPASGGGPHSF